jgi:HAD superfamily hydrolase (TIGR01459 family)
VRLTTFDEIAHEYELILLDMWGVIFNGDGVFAEAREFIVRTLSRRQKIVFVSNTSESRFELEQRVRQLVGIDIPAISSGEMAKLYIEDQCGFTSLRRLGCMSYPKWVSDSSIPITNSIPERATILGSGRLTDELTYKIAQEIKIRGASYMSLNGDDHTVHMGSVSKTSGYVCSLLDEAGINSRRFGKPDPDIFHAAISIGGNAPLEKVVVIGDSIDTDIAGAKMANLKSLLIEVTGIHNWVSPRLNGVEPDYRMDILR